MHRTRNGYTLMEMTLVVSLVVILAGLAVPVAMNMLAGSSVNAAADAVRARFSEARNRALEERRAYRFAVQLNTGKFRIAPETAEYWDDAGAAEDEDAGETPLVLEGNLPEKVAFCDPQTGPGQAGGQMGAGQGWQTVAVFLPDGSAKEDVEVCMAAAGAQPVTLRLRASTGTVSTASLRSFLPLS